MPVTLGLDTSGSVLLVTAQKNGKRVTRRRKGVQQERLLFPAVTATLAAVGATLQEVEKICIVRGPGRFTGIRIALTFASMLQALNAARVYGITLFELLYRQAEKSLVWHRWKAQHPEGVLGVVLHAFREEYFLQIFDGPQSKPMWLSREELLQRLAAYKCPLFLAGTDKEGASLASLTEGKYPLAADQDCQVRPEVLLAISQEDAFSSQALEPLYLKPARFELVTPR
ncbi:MAG: tRNA (adenosine(37)-N6)-threonylcarbamoyltransferase complex dimerization subunit type 1 TsaB [Elusimicrobiaceae bacterium]|nr:tRNA (adenosine(37)-N6)-threonylcarbamoyltransferase complex dimerization subunit type 1 TsaB [Elusimicrobiaceae bacterium]